MSRSSLPRLIAQEQQIFMAYTPHIQQPTLQDSDTGLRTLHTTIAGIRNARPPGPQYTQEPSKRYMLSQQAVRDQDGVLFPEALVPEALVRVEAPLLEPSLATLLQVLLVLQ